MSCLSQAYGMVLNNPYPQSESLQNIYYTSFSEQPKTLDPATSYSSRESIFVGQIYEPLLQYDYFARPYKLIPLTAAVMPELKRYDKAGKLLKDATKGDVDRSIYTIHIIPGILYQPHPAFAKDKQGHYLYQTLPCDFINRQGIHKLSDFKWTGTRELLADDYVYQIKRLADPRVNSPIYSIMSEHIMGFREYGKTLPTRQQHPGFLDLRDYPLRGARVIDNYTYEITLNGDYPQFMYWLAMAFFSPIPWEVDQFYSEPGMAEKNLSFDWYPIGTGPFMLTENNPNRRMVMVKNPNYRIEYFPTNGSLKDKQKGYMAHAGARIPLIDKAVFILEKETIPRWNKFLQGYYDLSGVATDSFDQAIAVNSAGGIALTPEMRKKGIHLREAVEPAVFYLGFNMLDPIVGGYSESARKLRQAISIAVNYDENISIFFNGRGESAQDPIPPGIFGHQKGLKGINAYVYTWKNDARFRRLIKEARRLMVEAGYPDGVDPATHHPLVLHYDAASTGGPDEKALLSWMIKEFAEIGVHLNIRATQVNRFQEKMQSGNAQIFSWGWSADYPDPENFLFLLYGPNGKVKFGGENATNYQNLEFDALFEAMKNRPNDAKRLALISRMIGIVQRDAPWAGGINAKIPILAQPWMTPLKPNSISQNVLKYMAIDVSLRNQLRHQWNQAVVWPAVLMLLLLALFVVLLFYVYNQRQRQPVKRIKNHV